MRCLVKSAAAVFMTFIAASSLDARAPAYAHKAGVTAEVHSADNATCWNDGMKAMNDPQWQNPWIRNPVTDSTVAGAAGGALARGMATGLEGGKRFKLTYHDCLMAKGYTLRRPDEAAWKRHKTLKKAERQEEMLGWSISPEPLHPQAARDEFD